jgi:hypothetical protein
MNGLGTLDRMNSRTAVALIVMLSCALVGCRQADGPMPVANGEIPNRLGDLGRDLQNVAGGQAEADKELAEDLRIFVDGPPDAVNAINELARRTSQVVSGKNLNEQSAQRLAHQLWTTVAAREMSARQVESLQNDTQALLVSLGVPEENAQSVASQVGDVQKAVTTRQRRWYEFF